MTDSDSNGVDDSNNFLFFFGYLIEAFEVTDAFEFDFCLFSGSSLSSSIVSAPSANED